MGGDHASDAAFVGATLIDGTGSPPVLDSAVVVSHGQIKWVGVRSELEQMRQFRLVDVAGKYLIPGLLDANVHLVLDYEPEVLLRYDPGCYDDLVVEAAQVALRAGITTVFDTWGPLESLRRVRDRINSGDLVGSRIFYAGNIIGNGGPWSGDFSDYGESLSTAAVDSVNWHWEQGVGDDLAWMSAADVRRAVREYIARSDIDFLKYAGSAHRFGRFIVFSHHVQRAIVEEAHSAGITAQACTFTPEALKLSIEAGVDLLQHGDTSGRYPMPDEILAVIVERQLPCVALIMTTRYIDAVTRNDRGLMSGVWERLMIVKDENDRRLIKAGAKLLLATDGGVLGPTVTTSPALGGYVAGVPDLQWNLGKSHILWLKAAIEREMSPMDALLATTRNIADAYAKSDELGTIEIGKRADLLVLDGNPLDDPENYGRIVHVVKDGESVDIESLPQHPVLTSSPQPG